MDGVDNDMEENYRDFYKIGRMMQPLRKKKV